MQSKKDLKGKWVCALGISEHECNMDGYTCEACPNSEWVWITDVSDLMTDVKADDGSKKIVKTSNSFQTKEE